MVSVAQDSAGRGRPRTFDEEVVLGAAMDLFWERGYRATTTRDLEAALGMSQPSIYNAFGSKQVLLLRAVEKYEERVETELLSLLDDVGDGYEAVSLFFRELADWVAKNKYRGCLVVNLMAAEVDDPVIADRVRDYRAKIRSALVAAIERTEHRPELVTARSDLLLAAVLGLHITARTAGATGEVSAMASGIQTQVAAWRNDQLAAAAAQG